MIAVGACELFARAQLWCRPDRQRALRARERAVSEDLTAVGDEPLLTDLGADAAELDPGLAVVSGIWCDEAHRTNSRLRGACPRTEEERE